MFADQCLDVNKSLNSICSSYKAIKSLQKCGLNCSIHSLVSGSCVASNSGTEIS